MGWGNRTLPSTLHVCVLSHFNHVWLFVILWTLHQAPLSTGFSRQEYWRGLPFPYLEDLPDPGINPVSLTSLAFAGEFFTLGLPRMSFSKVVIYYRVTSLGFEIWWPWDRVPSAYCSLVLESHLTFLSLLLYLEKGLRWGLKEIM